MLGLFLCNTKGGVAPLLALGIVPLIGSVGTAVDYSHAAAARTSMQVALDRTDAVQRGTKRLRDATQY